MDVHQLLPAACEAFYNLFTLQIIPFLQRSCGGKVHRSCRASRAELSGVRIVMVQDAYIIFCLIHGDVFFCRHICLHGMMAVQMIRGDVQDR
jgi:hypothetical protein